MNIQNHEIKTGDIQVASANEPPEILAENHAANMRPGVMPPPGSMPGTRPGSIPHPRPPHEPSRRPGPEGSRPHYNTRPHHAPPVSAPGRGGRLNPERAALQRCVGHTIHVWLKSGREFWFYPVYIGRTTVAGYAWKRNGWVYTGFSIHSIEFFVKL
ncbi:MAG: hypothetical protein FWE24_04095 [Defluviitaleaceae bacterium]|nr:hypothetical protein [Defluviitaleaceae bacterium]